MKKSSWSVQSRLSVAVVGVVVSAERSVMLRRWWLASFTILLPWGLGCTQMSPRTAASLADARLNRASDHPSASLEPPPIAFGAKANQETPESTLTGPQPVDRFIRRALVENRTVQAAFHNVEALKYRIPQVTTLDDPVASNAIFPIPSVAPQYSLMGYNPYNLTLAQQFPWFGTLRLRGEVAERDVQVALAELAAAQLAQLDAAPAGGEQLAE